MNLAFLQCNPPITVIEPINIPFTSVSFGLKEQNFRELFIEYMAQFQEKTGFRDSLMEQDHMKAFDELLKVWWDEYEYMENSGFTVLSIMHLVAAVHNQAYIEYLRERVQNLQKEFDKATRESQTGK